MQKVLSKFISSLVVITLVLIQLLPVTVMASEVSLSSQSATGFNAVVDNATSNLTENAVVSNEAANEAVNAVAEITTPITDEMKTSENNVLANVTINDSYNVKADIDDQVDFKVYARVLNTGYLKDISVKIENENYSFDKESMVNFKGTSMNGELTLNEVQAEEEVTASVKAKFTKNEKVRVSDFNKESKITFNAVYVNEAGKERKIKKEIKINVEWEVKDAESTIYQELIRYIKFDKKTMISFRINDEIKENSIPAKEKEITTTIPQINKKGPSVINIVGEYDEYKEENGNLVIKKNNTKEDSDEYEWKSDDSYIVTYIYDEQADINSIKSTATSKVKTILDKELTSKTEVEKEVAGEVGSLIELDIEGTPELNKGYMYTNLAREEKINTEFNISYKLNVGYKDIIDKVVLKETNYTYNETITEVVNTKVNTHKEELEKVLGEDGIITIKDKEGNVIGTLTKDVEELEINAEELTFETSKPVAEGIVTINIDKKVNDNIGYTREDIKLMQTLNTYATLEGYFNENVISNKNVVHSIKLDEPKSSADLAMEPRTLSTVVENQDVEINVRLNTADIEDALYTNPEIRIKLPDQVTGINITEGKLIYDKELVPADIRVEGNMIIAKMVGTQTTYNSDGIINGSLIKILANISLDRMATSSDEKLLLGVANEATGEVAEQSIDTEVVAPTGFITTNAIQLAGNEKEEAIDNKVEVQIEQGAPETTAKISGKVKNNLKANADGFTIIGRLPVEGVQDFNGQDLESKITTRLNSVVNVQGINAKVYYSENVNETIESTTWSETPTLTSKSFKIVATEDVPHAKEVTFDYDVTIPANVESGKTASSLFGVVYKTNAVEGEQYNIIQSQIVGMFTEGDDTLGVTVDVYDTNDPTKVINDENSPKSGQDVTYKVTIVNNGKTPIENINLEAELNNRVFFLNKNVQEGNNLVETVDKVNKSKTENVASLQPNESKELYYNVRYDEALTKDYVLDYKVHNKIINKQITDEEKLEILRECTECDEVEEYILDQNGNIQYDTEEKPLTKITKTPRISFEDYTDQMYKNLEFGGYAKVYMEIYSVLYELNNVTDEEVNEFNKATMSIKASYGNNGVRKKTFNKEVVIQEYNSAYMNIIADNNKILQSNEKIEVKVHVRAASMNKTGELMAYVNIPDGLKLINISADGMNGEGREELRNLENYYVKENNKTNYNKIAVPVKFMSSENKRYLEKNGTAEFDITLQANEVTDTKSRDITGYLEDKAYTIENDSIVYGDTLTVGTNSIPIIIEKKNAITAIQTANVEGVTSDSVPITFNVNIKSESAVARNIEITDNVPDKLVVKEVTLQLFDENKNETVKSLSVAQGLVHNFVLPAKAEANVVIQTIPKKMYKGESDLYINSPKVRSSGEDINVNEYQIKVEGSVDPETPPDEADPTDPSGTDTPDPSRNYILNGIIFIDEDYNGIRGSNDGRGKGNKLDLYKKNISNGKITSIEYVKSTTTNGLGEYKFEDVPVGEYYVIAEYDTKEYIVTKYKADKSTNTNNNDFTEEKLDGNTVATASVSVTSTDLYNIDLGLATRKNFSFKLDKFITGVKVTNSAYDTREYKFVNSHTAKIELPTKNVENTTVIAEYTIRITNIGKVAGTVESVIDYLPSGMRFLGTNNSGWYETQEGDLINTTLSQKEMQSGETVDLKLTLTKSINGENLGLVRNVSEIKALSSKSASKPDGQTPGNKQDGEDDMSGADLIILLGTGRETASIIGITITILALIACATYIMKKFVMDKSI